MVVLGTYTASEELIQATYNYVDVKRQSQDVLDRIRCSKQVRSTTCPILLYPRSGMCDFLPRFDSHIGLHYNYAHEIFPQGSSYSLHLEQASLATRRGEDARLCAAEALCGSD